MREISFRGKDFKGQWIKFNLFSLNMMRVGRMELGTIGQFTDLRDKNRVEIYEGDIVRFNNQVGEVVFENGTFGVGFNDFINWKRLEWDYKDSQIDDNILPACYNDYFISFAEIYNICDGYDSIEVIGNIYDNPELLEVE